MKGRGKKDIFVNIITLNVMSKAIANKTGIKKEKAKRIAGFIMDLFGYDNRIIDNILKPEDRQLLYMLEAEDLLTTGRDEEKLYDGREWLTHYWELRKSNILKYAKNGIKKDKRTSSFKMENDNISKRNIYNSLSDDVWAMRKNSGRTRNFRISSRDLSAVE
ncbi:MAG: DUF6015 family protein [Candidatus Thermoplasmatota archaeon]|nr:DUF6015 family protein [Candidatus Thermoplasmatota archaeon]